jgi:Ca-activated chloride channel family protein
MYSISHRLVILLSLFFAWGFFFSSHDSHAQKDAPDPNVVRVFFNPIDKNGRMIATLAQTDVRVSDDGKPQTILSFERMPEQPISVAVLIDTSMSEGRLQETAKLTARGFVASLVQSGRDQVAIIGFAGSPKVEQELTTEKEKAVQAIDRLRFATPASIGVGTILSGPTDPDVLASASSAIWDTIWNASEGLSVSSTAGTRRAILLLSDGRDTFSRQSMRDAIEGALRQDVAVFAIGMGDKAFEGVSESGLKKIAEETGGRAFFPRKTTELQIVFEQLSEQLHSPYVVSYKRTNRRPKGEIQKLKLQLQNPNLREVTLDYRRGYFSL